MSKWKEILRRLFLAGNNDEETTGSQRFRDTVAKANANPEQATKIYLDAAKDRAAETAAAVAIPLAGGAAGPVVADLATGAFVADGLYNLASGNGVQKTVQLAQQRDIQGTVKSAIGDALNLFALYPGLKLGKSAFTRFKNNLSIVSEPGFYYHGSPKTNITTFRPGKDGGIYWTSDAKAASGYTGIGTGKVYKSKLDPGSNPIEIDVGEDYWTRIPEEKVTNAFGLPKEEVYKQIGSYNLGIRPWYEDFLIPFGYKPKKYPYYAIDQIVKLGNKNKVTSINFKNAKDTGKGLISVFSKPKIYDQFVVYNPNQIHLQKQGGVLKGQNGLGRIPIIGKWLKDKAYTVITNPDVWWRGGANKDDIVKALKTTNKDRIDDNKYMFIYGVDRPETTDGQAFDWSDDIKENKYKNVRSYEGVLNPYGEYVVSDIYKPLVEKFADAGYSKSININYEYTDPQTGRIAENTPYFDDVHGYRIRFHRDKDGNPVISASDLYDFGKNYSREFDDLYKERGGTNSNTLELQRRLLNSVGQPYKLIQHNIPIRFVESGNQNFEDQIFLDGKPAVNNPDLR